MQDFPVSAKAPVAAVLDNWSLIKVLTAREILGRYRGSALGILWSMFNPVLMLLIYTFVFSVVFKARWTPTSESKVEFALVLFAGLLVFGVFSECINRSPTVILSNAQYVKKVVFPLEVLSFVLLGSALFHGAVSFLVWLAAYSIFFGVPHLTVLWFPVVLIPLLLYVLGFSWILASLGVYLRDVAQITSVITTILMFLSPVFYPITALPPEYRHWIYLNPMSAIVDQVRSVIYWGQAPDLSVWLLSTSIGAAVAYLGFFWFQKTRKGFADVL
jgi:lipopolysaccharide transport system permease protein